MPMRSIHLTAAEIKAAGPILKELVPAPGAGKTLIPLALAWRLNFLTLAFAAGSALDVNMGPAANANKWATVIAAAEVNDAESSIGVAEMPVAAVEDIVANMENQALNLCLAGAQFTTGLGSLDIDILYGISGL